MPGSVVAVVSLLACLVSAVGHAQMTGEDRNVFIRGAAASCLKMQSNAPQNAAVAPALINQYCECYADYMADTMSNERAENIAKGLDRINPNTVQMAARYCGNQLIDSGEVTYAK